MTPLEKAEELVLKFMNLQEPNYNWFHKILGKKCALIAVDEILKELLNDELFYFKTKVHYWIEVKNEINNL
jgi:nitrogenase molybdenum-iron protein alpha/beta subunit